MAFTKLIADKPATSVAKWLPDLGDEQDRITVDELRRERPRIERPRIERPRFEHAPHEERRGDGVHLLPRRFV